MTAKKTPQTAIANTEFDPNNHLIELKNGKTITKYLPVQYRLVWFRLACPHGKIETKLVHLDLDRDTEEVVKVWNDATRKYENITKTGKGIAIYHATVHDGNGGIAQGTKSEKAASFGDFIEKAETGAIGRALAALGYGTQFAPEFDEQHRIVDAPVPVRDDAPSDEQLARIRKGWDLLNKEGTPPTPQTYLEAKALIADLTAEYKSLQQQASSSGK